MVKKVIKLAVASATVVSAFESFWKKYSGEIKKVVTPVIKSSRELLAVEVKKERQ